MKAYHCDGCGTLAFFDNSKCVKCGHAFGFLPECGELTAIEPAENGAWRSLRPDRRNRRYRQCENGKQHQVCNWLVKADDPNPLCLSCRLNLTIPNLNVAGNHERWHRLEMAKRRLVYTILKLGLPMEPPASKAGPALRFNFLADVPGGPPVMTGHQDGVITINVAEADDDERERRRVSLHEPFRTLLGHFRHEVVHFFWDRLIAHTPSLEKWRAVFGDEQRDYAAALKSYYQQGPPPDWQSRYVSAYASAHPWEDWAETGAHYFHMIDTVETAASFGLSLHPQHPAAGSMTADFEGMGQRKAGFADILGRWYPLTYALNSLNRGMGLHDLYPFVLSTPAAEKLRFTHELFLNNPNASPN